MKIEKAVELAIENIAKEGLTDIFPRPYELDCLKNDEFKRKIHRDLVKRLKANSFEALKISPIQHVLYPKKTAFDFRRSALMLPMDTILYLALVLRLADVIEQYRIPKKKKRVFSYRFSMRAKNGDIFLPSWNYTAFRNHIHRKKKHRNVQFVVECDIANFYDRLNLHRLEQILLSLPVKKNEVKIINSLLLFWSNRDSYGLPVGSNASRILAETALIPIDNFLTSHNINYCRFVDDFRLFAPDITTAHIWLTKLIERLSLEGLFINPRKTKIEEVKISEKEEKEVSVFTPPKPKRSKPAKIIAGYTGLIPTKFREASQKEKERLIHLGNENFTELLTNPDIIEPKQFTDFLKFSIYSEKYDNLNKIPELLPKFPQLTLYTVDFLVKKTDSLPEETITRLQEFFSEWLLSHPDIPEYIAIAIVKLLGSEDFVNKEALLIFFRNLKRNSGAYIGRATLDALQNVVNREDVIEIRPYFQRADMWEKRAIIKMVDEHLEDEEKRPWLRNIKIHATNDHFSVGLFSVKECKKK